MNLKKETVLADVIRALEEDIGSGDVTNALLPSTLTVHAKIISREPMVVCGRPWVDLVFSKIDASTKVAWLVEEGSFQSAPTTLCCIEGLARSVLTAERTALNFLQTLSATATKTRRYVQELKGYHTKLLDTRKTLPGLRVAQKYAVATGNATNHRFGLYDAYLIKENHIKACGSITKAIELAKRQANSLLIEVEVETIDELREALLAQPDRILLDNFTKEMLVEAVSINTPKRCDLEVSGGVELNTIQSIAALGVDFISVGAITKSIEAIDLSLLIEEVR